MRARIDYDDSGVGGLLEIENENYPLSTWCCGYDNDNGKRTPCAMAMATMEIDGRARVAIERECLETGRRIYLCMTFTIFVCLSLSSHLRVSYEKGKKSDTKNGGKNSEAKWRERKCCEAGRNIAQPSTALRPPPSAACFPLTDFRFVREGQYEYYGRG